MGSERAYSTAAQHLLPAPIGTRPTTTFRQGTASKLLRQVLVGRKLVAPEIRTNRDLIAGTDQLRQENFDVRQIALDSGDLSWQPFVLLGQEHGRKAGRATSDQTNSHEDDLARDHFPLDADRGEASVADSASGEEGVQQGAVERGDCGIDRVLGEP